MREKLVILHLEDNNDDVELVREAIARGGVDSDIRAVKDRTGFLAAIASGGFDLILSDHGVPDLPGPAALEIARGEYPGIPFIFVSGSPPEEISPAASHDAQGYVSKDDLPRLASEIRRVFELRESQGRHEARFVPYVQAMERLVAVVQDLSTARDLDGIMKIVRTAARDLTGADGATFVLRDGDLCHYADEDAISPLWKGNRFPMETCISGWVMLNRGCAVIEDIYADPRIPADAYRPTFVKSLVMTPIRTSAPLGTIGAYWATPCLPPPEVVKVLHALADTTSVAMENVRLYSELEQRVKDRTAELETVNKELEAFSYSVSHDLRAPLRTVRSFSEMLADKCGDTLDDRGRGYLERVRNAAGRMSRLIDDLLDLSRTTRTPVKKLEVGLTEIVHDIASELQANDPERQADFTIQEGIAVTGDPGLLRNAMENLLSNAWKFTAKRPRSEIAFGTTSGAEGQTVYYVKDNGAGFEMNYAGKLFGVFQRLHSQDEFPGSGIGLATVQRIISKHGGRIWAEAEPDVGATFYFTLG